MLFNLLERITFSQSGGWGHGKQIWRSSRSIDFRESLRSTISLQNHPRRGRVDWLMVYRMCNAHLYVLESAMLLSETMLWFGTSRSADMYTHWHGPIRSVRTLEILGKFLKRFYELPLCEQRITVPKTWNIPSSHRIQHTKAFCLTIREQ